MENFIFVLPRIRDCRPVLSPESQQENAGRDQEMTEEVFHRDARRP
jgi:hypothetical protein